MIAFGHPNVLWGLLLVPALCVLVLWANRRHKARLSLFTGKLTDRLVQGGGRRRRRAFLRILALGWLFVAAADPRFGHKVEEVTQRGVDVLFLLDVSRSMKAEDVLPSRLAKARTEIRALAETLKEDRVGLIVFAGLPDVLCPLTLDRGAFRLFLDLADSDLIPIPGTDLGGAIRAGAQVLGEDDLKYKVLVLLTDGEDHEQKGLEAAKEAASRGIRIHTVNVGGLGAPLRVEHGFQKDAEGKNVFSKPDPVGLKKIAAVTGGAFYRASSPRIELQNLGLQIQSMEDRDLHGEEVQNLEERFQIPLFFALLCFFAELLLAPSRPIGGRRLA